MEGHVEDTKVIRDKHIAAVSMRERGFEFMVFSKFFNDADESGFILGGVEVFEVNNGKYFIPSIVFLVTEVVSQRGKSDKMVLNFFFGKIMYHFEEILKERSL